MPPSRSLRVAGTEQDQDPWDHRVDLLAYARRVLGAHAGVAEDVVQEAYLRMAEQDAVGRAPRDARPWLFRVVRNLALDERRRAAHAEPMAEPPVAAAPGSAPGEVLERREAAASALRQVAELPPRERRALVLDQAGIASADIAREMSTTPNAVHQALFRARRRLRAARAAAWAVMPLPLARLMLRMGDGRIPEAMTVASAPGSGGGRLLPLAGAAGVAVAGLIGGGATLNHMRHEPIVVHSETSGRLVEATPATTPTTAPVRERSAGTGTARVVGSAAASATTARGGPSGDDMATAGRRAGDDGAGSGGGQRSRTAPERGDSARGDSGGTSEGGARATHDDGGISGHVAEPAEDTARTRDSASGSGSDSGSASRRTRTGGHAVSAPTSGRTEPAETSTERAVSQEPAQAGTDPAQTRSAPEPKPQDPPETPEP